jgi:hypothetical protein
MYKSRSTEGIVNNMFTIFTLLTQKYISDVNEGSDVPLFWKYII